MQLKELRDAKKILIPRFDSHGDIILLSGFLRALIEMMPDAEVTILVREGQEQLAPLLPSKIKWQTTKIFPYKPIVNEYLTELNHLLSILDELSSDLLLTTSFNRTWLDYVVAAKLQGITRCTIGNYKPAEDWVQLLLKQLFLSGDNFWDNYVEVDGSSHEIEKYAIFYRHIFDSDSLFPLPKLEVMKKDEAQAKEIIKGLGLEYNDFFVCLPAGTQNVSIKCWPPDRFVELLLQIQSELLLKPLLIGHESETNLLNYIADKVVAYGGRVSKWIGKTHEFHILAGIIQKAKFYVGNDSGPMHMSTALGIPTVGIFGGGGYWPRFLPVGPYSVGVASILPCYGCEWDCTFGDAPCFRPIQVTNVLEAVKYVLRGDKFNKNMMLVKHQLSQETIEYITKANNQFTQCKYSRNKLAYDNAWLTTSCTFIHFNSRPKEYRINTMMKKIMNFLLRKNEL